MTTEWPSAPMTGLTEADLHYSQTVRTIQYVRIVDHEIRVEPLLSLDYQLREALIGWLRDCVNREHAPVSCRLWWDGKRISVTGYAKDIEPYDYVKHGGTMITYYARVIDAPHVVDTAQKVTPTHFDSITTTRRTRSAHHE